MCSPSPYHLLQDTEDVGLLHFQTRALESLLKSEEESEYESEEESEEGSKEESEEGSEEGSEEEEEGRVESCRCRTLVLRSRHRASRPRAQSLRYCSNHARPSSPFRDFRGSIARPEAAPSSSAGGCATKG